MYRTIYMVLLAAVLVFNFSCKKDDSDQPQNNPTPNTPENPVANLKKLGECYVNGASAKAVVYAEKDLVVGHNPVYVLLYDSVTNALLTDGHLTLSTLMDMGSMKHASPVEQSETSTPDKGLYKVAVVFQMASGSMGSWKLLLQYHNHKIDKEGDGELNITVTTPTATIIKTVTTSDSAVVLISFIKPMSPKVGINDFEILLNKKESMMSFPAITDYEVEINPEMPSMGHGSPNNVNPVHTAKGHYAGKVNFTMTGLWRVHIKLKKNGSIISESAYFDMTF